MENHVAEKLLCSMVAGKTIAGNPFSLGHMQNVAELARNIATACGMDSGKAYTFGLLHDIGRLLICDEHGEVVLNDKHMHPLAGYSYLLALGYEEEARICITHAFIHKTNIYSSIYNQSENELISGIINCDYDEYDLLIQLADEMSIVDGWCSLETRLIRKTMHEGYNYNDWEDFILLHGIKGYFDKKAGKDIYDFILSRIIFA